MFTRSFLILSLSAFLFACGSDDSESTTNNSESNDPVSVEFIDADVRSSTGAGDGSRVWLMIAPHADGFLSLQVFEALGGPTAPGETTFTEADTEYTTCRMCLVLHTECAAPGSIRCDRLMMPRAEGSLKVEQIDDVGGRFVGELQDVVFQEVEILEGDFETQIIPEGKTREVTWAFDSELEQLLGRPEVCSGNGHLHGNRCHCNAGFRLDPEDFTRCIPE